MPAVEDLWIVALLFLGAWVGHAWIWTAQLNYLYGLPLPKWFLKPWRLFTGVLIIGAPGLFWVAGPAVRAIDQPESPLWLELAGIGFLLYLAACGPIGLVLFPATTLVRLLRARPDALLSASSRTVDLWPEHRHALLGDGKWRWVPRLPFNDVFRVEFTELTLHLPTLPSALDRLTVHLLSDLHFHGTPSKLFFDRVLDEIDKWPTPDVVALAGDYLDSDRHLDWMAPLLGRLKWKEAGLAILGNHDAHHQPDKVRAELDRLGFRVLSGRWEEVSIRGVSAVACGHEGPWLGSAPDLSDAPADRFRLCLSHTPDQFYWGQRNGIDLMLCGHVHGGQVRLPVIGSIFVPSVYGRRFDMGVFQENGTLMVVGRGLSGKEPLRFRCRPQVLRLTLVRNVPARPASES